MHSLKILDSLRNYPIQDGESIQTFRLNTPEMPDLKSVPGNVKAFAISEYAKSKNGYSVLAAKNARLLVWKWNKETNSDFVCIPVLNDSFAQIDRYWALYYNFGSIEQSSGRFQLKFDLDSVPTLRVEGELTLLGGHDTYGHWLADKLALAVFCVQQQSTPTTPFLTFNLRAWQLDILTSLYPEIPIRNFDLSTLSSGPLVLSVDSLKIIDYIDIATRYKILRDKFAGLCKPNNHRVVSGAQKKLVYLRRGPSGTNKAKRVLNSEQIINLVERFGGIAIDPSEMTFRQKLDFFSEDQLIVNEPGSGEFNFHLFSSENAKLIQLANRTMIDDPNHQCIFASWLYLLPRLARIRLLAGDTRANYHYSNGYTDPSTYSLDELCRLLTEEGLTLLER